jgi:hypothetical protein
LGRATKLQGEKADLNVKANVSPAQSLAGS